MGSVRIFGQFLIISVIYFIAASAFAIPEKYKKQLKEHVPEGDEKECTKKIIDLVTAEDSGKLGDFHGKSDVEKAFAIWLELRQMFRNGNNITAHFDEGITEILQNETLKGDDYVHKVVQRLYEHDNETEELLTALKDVPTCVVSTVFELAYKITKQSVSTGRLGASDTYFAMVKDVVTGVNTEKQKLHESIPFLFVSSSLFAAALPDFVLSAITLVSHIPEHALTQFLEEFPKAFEAFDANQYLESLNLVE